MSGFELLRIAVLPTTEEAQENKMQEYKGDITTVEGMMAMPLHSTIVVNESCYDRVPGGWVKYEWDEEESRKFCCVFIPEPDDAMTIEDIPENSPA